MSKRILSFFVAVLLVVGLMAGCKKNVGTPEDNAVVDTEEEAEEEEPGYLFGYSGIDLSNPYFDTLKLALDTSVKDHGDRFLVRDPGSDAQLQNQQIQEMIEAGVDAIFLCPVDWEAITPALEALNEAEIPIINVDTQVREVDLVDAYVGSDNRNAGFVCGEDLKERRPNGGQIVILESSSMNSINERITGFEEAILDAGFEVLARESVNGQKQAAKEMMLQMLQSYSKIDAVMCGNDQMAMGVLEACKEAGRSEMLIYGVDGSPDVKKMLAEGEARMAGTGAQSPIDIGKTAVETALAILNGEDYEEMVQIETFFIDKDNVEMYGTDGWQ